jgi:hypothetical protein
LIVRQPWGLVQRLRHLPHGGHRLF